MESPSLEVWNTCPDTSDLIWCWLVLLGWAAGWTRLLSEVYFSLHVGDSVVTVFIKKAL